MISMGYRKLTQDLKPELSYYVLAEGTITPKLFSCGKERGLVLWRWKNSAALGEGKNLPGLIVELT